MNSCNDGTEPMGEAPDLPDRTPRDGADRPICFVDTETLGLEPEAPIWEFAAIRVSPLGAVKEVVCQIDINQDVADEWLETLRPEFAEDYRTRYDPEYSLYPHAAASTIWDITAGAVIVGCNPAFDLDSQRLGALLQAHDLDPHWHYHPLDTASMALAWLWARGIRPPQPWKSDELSRLIGVDPAHFDRHTALGDAKWCRAQWDRMQR